MKATIGNVTITGYQKADGPGQGRKGCPHCGGYTIGARSLHCAHCGALFAPPKKKEKVVKTDNQDNNVLNTIGFIRTVKDNIQWNDAISFEGLFIIDQLCTERGVETIDFLRTLKNEKYI